MTITIYRFVNTGYHYLGRWSDCGQQYHESVTVGDAHIKLDQTWITYWVCFKLSYTLRSGYDVVVGDYVICNYYQPTYTSFNS